MSDAVSKEKINISNQGKDSQESPSDIYIEVYKHYHELALNEDRLFNERLMVFLTSHSILFLGFVMCFQVQYVLFHIVGIFLSFVGIALCVFGYILVYPAWKTWEKWVEELEKMERKFKKSEMKLKFPYEVRKELEEEHLFRISSNFKTDLENNKLSEKLKKSFKDKKHRLSNNVKTSTIDKNEWEISDGRKKYTIREPGNQLKMLEIYEKGRLRNLKSGEWPWRIGCRFLPFTFFLLWGYSSYISLCQVFC